MNSLLIKQLGLRSNIWNRLSQTAAVLVPNQLSANGLIDTNQIQTQTVCNRFYTTVSPRSCVSLISSGNQWPVLRQSALASVVNVPVRSMAHKLPLTYDFIRERILLLLKLYDKIDPEKLTLDSHFYKDLGLDSLDHVEVIMAIEDEFHFEIPDSDAEKLLTPRDILKYISDKEEAYEGLQTDDHTHH